MRNLFIVTTVGLILVLSAGCFHLYKKNMALLEVGSQLQEKTAALLTEKSQLQQNVQELSVKIHDLQLQYDKQNCTGRWENNTCVLFTAALSVTPASGRSPLSVTLTAKVPNMNYTMDYGDGSSSWLSQGPNAQSAGECVPDGSGLCTVKLKHVYSSKVAASFKAALMKGGAIESTTVINTTP